MDKTGTLTKGVFNVQLVNPVNIEKDELIKLTAALEQHSTHPIAKAVTAFAANAKDNVKVEGMEEISGHGLKGIINGKEVMAGNLKLLKKFNINYPQAIESIVDTIVVTAIDKPYAGYITIADEIKEDAAQAIKEMPDLKLQTVMLSGDKQQVVDQVAKTLELIKLMAICCLKAKSRKSRH